MKKYQPFVKSESVWPKSMFEEMNITCGFRAELIKKDNCNYKMNIAATSVYRLFINGELYTYGPARCAHGFYRVDEIDISDVLINNKNVISLEVASYNINSFSCIKQSPFLQAEIFENNKSDENSKSLENNKSVIFTSSKDNGFLVFRLHDRIQHVQRYSFQRVFAESYYLSKTYSKWRYGDYSFEQQVRVEPAGEKTYVRRGMPLFKYPVCRPDRLLYKEKAIMGELPANAKKDRALTGICDTLEGFTEQELEVHLTDEVQSIIYREKMSIEQVMPEILELDSNQAVIMSFPIEKSGYICLDLICKKVGKLYILCDELLNPDKDVDPVSMECVNVIKLDVEEGLFSFQSFDVFGFKFLKLVCLEGAFSISDIHIKESICSVDIPVKPPIPNKKLDEIYQAAVETFKQNVTDIFMDCPTRERAGWLYDSFFIARAEKALTGKNIVEKAFLENFLLPETFANIPDGMIPMCYPSDQLDGMFIPNWALWFVIELEDYQNRTNDKAFTDLFKGKIYKLLSYFEAFENEYELLEKLESWVFIEWSETYRFVQDVNFPTNMLYAGALRAVGNLFDDEKLIEKSLKLQNTIRKRSFNGEFFVDNEIRVEGVLVTGKDCTEACQYYAFFFETATPESHPELWNTITSEFGPKRIELKLHPEIYHANAMANYLRLDILTKYNLKTQVLDEIKQYFYEMAVQSGTLWENMTSYASCNHGFASYAAYLIDRNLKRFEKI